MIFGLFNNDDLSPLAITLSYNLFVLIMQNFTFLLILFLMFACRNRGVISSGVLFNFWALSTFCMVPRFYYRVSALFDNAENLLYHLKNFTVFFF